MSLQLGLGSVVIPKQDSLSWYLSILEEVEITLALSRDCRSTEGPASPHLQREQSGTGGVGYSSLSFI